MGRSALLIALLSLLMFVSYFFRKELKTMFGKDKNVTKTERVTPPEAVPVQARQPESVESSQGNTVIASDVCFDGNISATGMVYIHGKVLGNIESKTGLIKVMRNGYVEGNIIAKEAVIDGRVIGQCDADSIDIHENGKINGAILYHNLSIKRGGEFTGQSEIRPATTGSSSNVIDIITDKESEFDKAAEEDLLEANQ